MPTPLGFTTGDNSDMYIDDVPDAPLPGSANPDPIVAIKAKIQQLNDATRAKDTKNDQIKLKAIIKEINGLWDSLGKLKKEAEAKYTGSIEPTKDGPSAIFSRKGGRRRRLQTRRRKHRNGSA